jgi:hypothetical protein
VSEANQITSRNRGHKIETVIDELKLYIRGWLNYYKLSSTYKEVLALSVWVRRRVRDLGANLSRGPDSASRIHEIRRS